MASQSARIDTRLERAKDLPNQYMQKRAPSLHVAYGDSGSQHDSHSHSYIISNELDLIYISSSSEGQALAKLASDETEKFKEIMEEFARHHSSSASSSVNIRDQHSWAGVMAQLTLAKEKHENQAKGKKGAIRKAGRWISDHAEIVDPYIKLVPDTDYSSVICGGLKFVFGAAVEYSKIRKDVLDALESLPDEIEEAGDCLQRFSEVLDQKTWERLKDKALRLYIAILAVIEGILLWLDENAFKKLTKTLMLQKGYGKNVTNMIEELKTRSGDLKHTAATCGQTVAVENLTVTKQTRALGGHNLTMALRSYELGSINNQQGRETLGTAQDTLKAVTALHAKVGTHAVLEDDRKRQTSEFAAVLEYASWRFEQASYRAEQAAQRAEQSSLLLTSHTTSRPETTQSPHLNRQQIQAILRVDVHALGMVLDKVASDGLGQKLSSTALTSRILGVPRFRDWLQRDSSGTILLRTTDDITPSQRITRLSQFSAALLTTLKDIPLATPSHYFCGVMSLDGEQGHFHMLRCLTAELLELWPADTTFPVAVDFAKLMSHEFEPLWSLFTTIVQSRAHATVFCVVDFPIRYFEETELILTVRWLQWLQNNLLGNIKLKMLVTWPAPSGVVELFQEEDQVLLSTGIHDTQGLGQNMLQRAMMEDSFRELSSER